MEMIRLLQPYVYPGRSPEAAAPAIRNGSMRISEGLALDMASIEDQSKRFQDEGLVSADITMETFVDGSYQTATN